MGISISTTIKSKKLHRMMLDFLEKNYEHPAEFIYSSNPKADLDYDRGAQKIGFNISPADDDEQGWVWSVMKWIADTAGRKIHFKGMETSVPYIRYDGIRSIPVTKDSPEGWRIAYPVGDKYEVRATKPEDMISEEQKLKLIELSEKWRRQLSDKEINARTVR